MLVLSSLIVGSGIYLFSSEIIELFFGAQYINAESALFILIIAMILHNGGFWINPSMLALGKAKYLTIITAITSQNTQHVSDIEPVSINSLKSQFNSILSDFHIDAIKIGMVYNSQIIKVINSKLRRVKVPIIVDPIIKSTTGAILLKKNARHDYKKMIIPMADIITPNRYEAKVLSGQLYANKSAKKIQSMGAKCVIITGATSSNGKISDFVLEENIEYVISGKKIPIRNHGSGCNYSASIAVSLARGNTCLLYTSDAADE